MEPVQNLTMDSFHMSNNEKPHEKDSKHKEPVSEIWLNGWFLSRACSNRHNNANFFIVLKT